MRVQEIERLTTGMTYDDVVQQLALHITYCNILPFHAVLKHV